MHLTALELHIPFCGQPSANCPLCASVMLGALSLRRSYCGVLHVTSGSEPACSPRFGSLAGAACKHLQCRIPVSLFQCRPPPLRSVLVAAARAASLRVHLSCPAARVAVALLRLGVCLAGRGTVRAQKDSGDRCHSVRSRCLSLDDAAADGGDEGSPRPDGHEPVDEKFRPDGLHFEDQGWSRPSSPEGYPWPLSLAAETADPAALKRLFTKNS